MSEGITMRCLHTADLDNETLTMARALLDDVFAGEMTDEDWEHCLGGTHCLMWEGAVVIGHAALVQRRLIHDGRALRTGYVEGVAVRADRRHMGHATTMMKTLQRLIRDGYHLGALGASEDGVGLYTSLGWKRWLGPTSAMTLDGIVPTPEEDGYIFVFPASADLDLSGELTCDWREGELW